MLCPFAKREWMTLLAIGVLLSAAAAMLYWWWVVMAVIVVVAALLLFFRDPQRTIPSDRHVMVSPADGRVSSVHEVAHFEPFGGPGEIPGLGSRDERLEVPQFHAVIIAVARTNSPTFASSTTVGVR